MELLLLYVLLFLISGLVTGVAGFGFAILSTVALTSVLDPSTSVALVIPSFIAVNASLVTNLNYEEFKSCGRRFYPYIISILVTSIVGMLSVSLIPSDPLRVALGFLTLSFVALQFESLKLGLTESVENRCFVESNRWMIILGVLSGLVFGSTNIGVQMVAYLESCDLSKKVFAGVIGMTFIGVNTVRFGVAAGTGMYSGDGLILLSLILVIPSSAGVLIGKKLQNKASDDIVSWIVHVLLVVIGIYLIVIGLGVI